MTGRAAVIGLGTMGLSIARLLRANHVTVAVYDERAFSASVIESEGVSGVEPSISIAECVVDADIVFEAVFEDLDVKARVLREISESTRAVIASNTSTFPPSTLAQAVQRPERFLVAHFFNPADVIPLVEVVPCRQTERYVVADLCATLIEWGKHPVTLAKERVGFVANRLQAAILRESLSLVEDGVVTAEELDDVVINALAPRWSAFGPLGVADLGGLDVFSAVCAQIFPTLSNATTPSEVLLDRISTGELGAKSGVGFYKHTAASTRAAAHTMSDMFTNHGARIHERTRMTTQRGNGA